MLKQTVSIAKVLETPDGTDGLEATMQHGPARGNEWSNDWRRLSCPQEPARVEIGCKRCGIDLRARQGNIAVWSHEIDGIAAQACPVHLRPPRKNVKRQFSRIA